MILALALAAGLAASPPIRPDPQLTPGVVDPAATLQVICVRGYTAHKGVRHVTAATKRAVFRRYGVEPKVGGPYEIDHLISLELGGSNDLANLWPQSYTSQPWNAHLKDALEDRLHAKVCWDGLPLAVAQADIAIDWPAAYGAFVAAPLAPPP